MGLRYENYHRDWLGLIISVGYPFIAGWFISRKIHLEMIFKYIQIIWMT